VVRLVRDADGKDMAPTEYDSSQAGASAVAQCVSPGEAGIDPGKVLGME
jgi:hypothetical protein